MQGPSMAADRQTPWWIRLNLGDDAGTADWRTPSWCRHDLSDDVAEHAHYAEAQRVARQRQYVWDADMVIRAMAQLAAQDGETAAPDHVQAVFRDLLCEFRQQADCTAEFAAETDGSMLAAFCRRQAEMLSKAKARLHSSKRHSKTERQAFGGRITVPAPSASPARQPAWATATSLMMALKESEPSIHHPRMKEEWTQQHDSAQN